MSESLTRAAVTVVPHDLRVRARDRGTRSERSLIEGAHDLSFSRNWRRVWVSSVSHATVFDAISQRVVFRVPVGPPPQQIAISRP
jgi:hypothetical protein